MLNPFSHFPQGTWTLAIHDDFTGSNGSINGRTPNILTEGSNTWGDSTSASITSNRVQTTTESARITLTATHGMAAEAVLTLGGTAGSAAAFPATAGTHAAGVVIDAQSTNRYFRFHAVAGRGLVLFTNDATSAKIIWILSDVTTYATNTTHTLRLEKMGEWIRAYSNGTEVWSGRFPQDTGASPKYAGIASLTAGSTKYYDDFKAYYFTPA